MSDAEKKKYMTAIEWLALRGVEVPESEHATVEAEFHALSLELGYNPEADPDNPDFRGDR